MLVGLVVARGCEPKKPCTASFVTNPKDVPDTPDMVVEEVRVPEHRDARGHATLRGQVVATDQAKRQPAQGPVTFTPSIEEEQAGGVVMEMALADKPNEPVEVSIENLPPVTPEHHHERASAPPVLPDSGICVVHDKFSGNGHATRISLNGTQLPVFVESPSMVAFIPGDVAKTGANEFTVTDNGISKTYEVWNPAVTIAADKSTLERRESTAFYVNVTGLPKGNTGGSLALTIKNDSPDTTTMSGGNLIVQTLYPVNIASGNYTYQGTITAHDQPGPFQIEASLESRLAEAPPKRVTHLQGWPIAAGAPIGCCQYWNPASGNWCADETQNECLGTWKGTNWKCKQNGSCSLNGG
jgi:hypothetical protein